MDEKYGKGSGYSEESEEFAMNGSRSYNNGRKVDKIKTRIISKIMQTDMRKTARKTGK